MRHESGGDHRRLDVRDVSVRYRGAHRGEQVDAVRNVSFSVEPGGSFGLVGESGAGKSSLIRAIAGYIPLATGRVVCGGVDLARLGGLSPAERSARRAERRRRQLVPQDTGGTLNPRLPVGTSIAEGLLAAESEESDDRPGRVAPEAEGAAERFGRAVSGTQKGAGDSHDAFGSRSTSGVFAGHPRLRRAALLRPCNRLLSARFERVSELLERVGLDGSDAFKRPAEFSGGQRQRICIARALAADPDLLLLDEPTASLDASVAAKVIRVLQRLRAELGMTFVVVSHDLAVVIDLCDTVGVLRDGRLIECNERARLFEAPEQEYTRTLIAAAPRLLRRPDDSVWSAWGQAATE